MGTNLVGQVLLGQFRVDSFIAAGGMGAVYKVYDLRRNVNLAMKVLQPDLLEDPAMMSRFKREADVLMNLAHPNIVPFYGMFQANEITFLVQRFIDGPTLQEYLRRSPQKTMPISQVLIFLRALCSALSYAHNNGVVHCDIKSANVMVDQGGNIYLADFGITRHAGSSLTNYGVIGTPAYMAPEQLLGQTVSSATDVYALGVLLYELVTGQKPFRGDHPSSAQAGESITDRLRFEHLRLVPPDPTAYQHDLPPQVADVMLKTLEKNPTLRYDDVMHLFEDFCHACGVFPESVPDRISLEGMPPPQVVQKTGATEVEPNIAQPRNIPAVQSPTFAPESGLWDHPLRRNTVVIGAPPEKKQTNRWLIGCLGLATLAGITGIIGIGIFILLSPTGFDFILFRKTTATPTTAPPEPSLTASRPTNAIMPTTTFTARPAPARPTDTPFPIQPSQTRSPTVRTPPTPTPLSKSMIEVFNQGASVKGEPLLWKRIGVGSKTLVIIGNIHGSEINTGDLVQKLSEQVDWWMKAVGQEKQIYFFPRMNPDGVGVNDYLNANGVDLNRNWQTSNWQSAATGNYGKNMPGKGGSAPFSEPETNATKNFLLRLQASSQTPLIVISYHSATAPGVVQPSYTITSAGQVNDRQATLLAKDIALWLNYQYIDRWTAYQITGELIHWCGEQGIVCVDIELPNKNMVDAAALALHKEMISNLLNTRWR